MISKNQKKLIENLHEILCEIHDEALNDEDFYNWLNENYFFQENLEDIMTKINSIKQDILITDD